MVFLTMTALNIKRCRVSLSLLVKMHVFSRQLVFKKKKTEQKNNNAKPQLIVLKDAVLSSKRLLSKELFNLSASFT